MNDLQKCDGTVVDCNDEYISVQLDTGEVRKLYLDNLQGESHKARLARRNQLTDGSRVSVFRREGSLRVSERMTPTNRKRCLFQVCEKLFSNRIVTVLSLITLTIFLAMGVLWHVNNPQDKNSISSILLLIGVWTYAVIIGFVRECIVWRAVAESKKSKSEK